ncbi:MAG: hypothetical protein QOE05_937 [Actinomycetota bacterium]|jgi:hypothetical protein|nr:hypothetical protein [Actinomycetota bacterium]
MAIDLSLRRHLYEQAAAVRGRRRRTLRKQLKVLALASPPPTDGGAAGVREPRRPHPPTSPMNVTVTPGL